MAPRSGQLQTLLGDTLNLIISNQMVISVPPAGDTTVGETTTLSALFHRHPIDRSNTCVERRFNGNPIITLHKTEPLHRVRFWTKKYVVSFSLWLSLSSKNYGTHDDDNSFISNGNGIIYDKDGIIIIVSSTKLLPYYMLNHNPITL